MDRAAKLAPPLRVVLVDDHEVVRTGLVTAIKDHRIEVVGQAEDVDGAVAVVRDTSPDVLVLDVRLPGGGGHVVLQRLGDDAPPTLAVSSSDERDDVLRTVGAGASGYLLKTAPVEDIAAAIRATADGTPVFSPELAGHVMDLDLDAAKIDDPEWEALTDREREVLRLLARGHTYNKIADSLVVSPKTVETH
ncbi:MAG: response regulator transcription factor, partial [Nitriliruptorales bacterium]|nr:response regulator transcription factor [Nitriliruptorales bacterium]